MINISESIRTELLKHEAFDLIETMIGEEYPQSFNMGEFKKLTSFKARIEYCQEHLKRISSGSSRIVYMIDDEKVLKLAKNNKGIAQNEVEYDYAEHLSNNPVLAKVFDADKDNNTWIEMELARKLNEAKFKQITGHDWKYFAQEVINVYREIHKQKQLYRVPEDAKMALWDDEVFCYQIFKLMETHPEFKGGDLARINSYGIVKRGGSDRIVLIDFGLTNNVWDSYYS